MTESTQSGTHIGHKITALREAHDLSIEELAQRVGYNADDLKSIEDSPTASGLAPLIKITSALGVRLGTLLDDDNGIGPVLTRAGAAESAGARRSLETGTSDAPLDFFSLAQGKVSRHMDPFIINIAPGTAEDISSHEGEEFIYVLEGAVEIVYGKDTFTLKPGDSIYYDSIVPHQVRDGQDATSTILACVYTPA
ncbi:MAG: cupin domain-containing protein [Coriobacteriia bacterium]|nr:cupin domain-containing protein [Coriobacteriia bacterium]